MAHKLHAVERCLDQTTMEQMDEMEVMELLESMTEVKNDYQNLRKDIQEVQQLQRDVSSSIRFQMSNMQQTFHQLKKRIASSQQRRQRGGAGAGAGPGQGAGAGGDQIQNTSLTAATHEH